MHTMVRRRLLAFLVLPAVLAALALPAASAVPPKKKRAAPTIKACANKKTGSLALRKGRKCRKGWRAVVWSVRGPRGARGARGLAGPRGPEGGGGGNASARRSIFTARGTLFSSAASPGYAGVSGITEVTSTEAQVETLAPATGFTARSLAVIVNTVPQAGSTITVTLRNDGAGTALGCTITGPATSCSNTGSSAAISPGSRVSLEISSTGVVLTTAVMAGFEGV
jgi:hypothetical protein